ncbi:fnci-1 [Pristionchus pacificus]|nr:fnci-1 [Pristionchus pacificus]
MSSTQPMATQGGTQRANSTIAEYIRNLNNQARKILGNDASQVDVARFNKAIEQLTANDCARLSKLIAHLFSESASDGCKHLVETAQLFFIILGVTTVEKEVSEARQFYFSSLLDHIFSRKFHLSAFVDLCTLFSDQSAKFPIDQLVTVLDTVTAKVKSADETVNEQWRECVSILISRLLESTDGGGDKTGASLASALLCRWLREAGSTTVFASVVAIIEKCGATFVLRSYVHGDLQKALDSFESLNENEKKECSLRTIEVMDKTEDESKSEKGVRERLVKALINVWSSKVEGEQGHGDLSLQPNDVLNPSIVEFHRVIQTHAVIGKLVMHLFKNDRARLLSSQFGFAALISVVATDRHGVAALVELKKCIGQLFRADNELMSTGWVAECMGGVTEELTTQLRSFVDRLVRNVDVWHLLSPPLLRVAYALMETPQGSFPLAISDGRIVNGPKIWMLAAEVIKTVVVAKPAVVSVGPSLLQLIEAISSAMSSNAALVLVDVLVEVVREHSADVLNNTKVLESISEYASRLRRDVSISLVRSLLPIFHQRVHLREALMLVLKKDLLHDKTVACAVPLLLLLFHSLNRNGGGANASQRSQFSQSFATFSSQSLAGMGTSRPRDAALCMQIIGCLRRCLTQSASLKAALYMGLAHAVTRDTAATASPCLDLLLGHSTSMPEWKAAEVVQSTDSLCHLKEALPQFIYALNSVTNTLVSAPVDVGGEQRPDDNLLEQATEVLNGWAKRAADRELDELALDKISSWNRGTAEGRSTILFGECIKGVYDALIGYLWMRVSVLDGTQELQWLNAILGKKKALRELMSDVMVKRKEVRGKGGDNGEKAKEVQIDEKSCEVPVPMSTLADMLEELIGKEEPRQSLDGLSLLTWAVEKTKMTAESLDKTSNTEVHERTSTGSVIAVAKQLLILYKGDATECGLWLQGVQAASALKTHTIVAYSHLLNWLLSRHTKRIEKIATIWRRGGNEEGGTNGELMRHINLIVSKLLPALLGMVRSADEQEEEGADRDKERKKAERTELETQIKTLLKMVEHLLSFSTSPKAPSTTFKFCVNKLLKGDSTAVNNPVLREIFRLMRLAAMRSPHEDGCIDKFLESLGAQVMSVLNDEVLEDTLDCVSPLSANAIVDFLFTTLEDDFDKMRALTNFTAHYASDEQMVSKILGAVASRAVICIRRLVSLMNLHEKDFAKDKLTLLLTSCFTTLDEFFKKLHEVSKPFKIKEWKMIPSAHSLVSALSRLLANVDENVGQKTKEEEEKKKKSKRKYVKTKKEETLFIKFVRAREGVQSRVLILSKTLDDAKFNLQVKNNSIGLRDFRLDHKILAESIKRAAEMDKSMADTSVAGQPEKKKRKRKSNDEENARPGSPAI